MPGSVLDAEDTAGTKPDKDPCLDGACTHDHCYYVAVVVSPEVTPFL